MNTDQLKEKISAILPKAEFTANTDMLTVIVPPENLFAFAKELNTAEELAFDYLMCLSGVDYGKTLSVFYHILSVKHNHSLAIKVSTDNRDNPAFDSVYGIWKSAEYHEREAYDLLGIKFNNHPDLRRMFLDESWVGHPLRKDYVDKVNIIER